MNKKMLYAVLALGLLAPTGTPPGLASQQRSQCRL